MNKKKRRNGKLKGYPKFKVWFPAENLLDMFYKDHSSYGTKEFCNRIGIDGTRLSMISEPGYLLGETTADRYAIKCGRHPSEIWPDWFDYEPEGGSNPKFKSSHYHPKEKKHTSTGQDHIDDIDKPQL